jgi:hypothetical protein
MSRVPAGTSAQRPLPAIAPPVDGLRSYRRGHRPAGIGLSGRFLHAYLRACL